MDQPRQHSSSPKYLLDIIIGIVLVTVLGGLAVLLFGVFARPAHSFVNCMTNQRNIAVSLQIYAQDHGVFPAADIVWQSIKMAPRVFKCPVKREKGVSTANDYAYNVNISGENIGAFFDPTAEVMTMDTHNTAGGFNPTTGTVASNAYTCSAANALLLSPYAQPLANVFYAPGDEDAYHMGKVICSYLDGHVALADITPESDVPWRSFDAATISYGPTAINNAPHPHGGYSAIEPHVGSAVAGANLRTTYSTLGLTAGHVSWRFSKENVADTHDCTLGLGGNNAVGTACSSSHTALYFFAVGNHGQVRFYQNALLQGQNAFGTAYQIGPTCTYTAADVFSLTRFGGSGLFAKNGKVKGKFTSILDNGTKTEIFVFTAPGANAKNGVTNVMASGLR